MREGNAYRLASSLAIAGVVVVAVASRFHGGAEPQNLLSVLPKYAANPYWKAVHLGQFLGFLLMASALILILNDLRQVSASPLATLGIVTAIVRREQLRRQLRGGRGCHSIRRARLCRSACA